MTKRIHKMTRRSFLSVAAMTPIGALGSFSTGDSHHFHHDHIIGTSLDLVVWSREAVSALQAESIVLTEIQRLSSILNTRDPGSEICRRGESLHFMCSNDLKQVLNHYAYWERQTGGAFSIRPGGPGARHGLQRHQTE